MYGSTMFLVLGVTSAANHPALWTTRGVDPGSLTVAAGLATGGSLTEWLREILGQPSFEELLTEAERAAPGARACSSFPTSRANGLRSSTRTPAAPSWGSHSATTAETSIEPHSKASPSGSATTSK